MADRRIAEGKECLARQLKLVERMAAAGHDSGSAERLRANMVGSCER